MDRIDGLFFVEALFYAWCRVQCVNAGYGIDRQTRRHQALLKERNTMKIELARLKSPERIETIARTRLGLVMPDGQQMVILP
jgi:cell division protein FtsL